MSSDSEQRSVTKEKQGPRYTTRLIFLLCVGASVSAFLLYHHVSVNLGYQVGPSICNFSASFNCDKVALSRYSQFLGIPVASWGMWYFLGFLLLILLLAPLPDDTEERKSAFADVSLFVSFVSLLPTVALAIVAFTKIGSLCLFCLMLYLTNILLFLVAVRNEERSPGVIRGLTSGAKELVSLLSTTKLAGNSAQLRTIKLATLWIMVLLTAGLLLQAPALLQASVFEPRQEQLVSRRNLMPVVRSWQQATQYEGLVSDSDSLLEKDFSIGPKNAPLTLVEFSDFQCPYCRRAANYLKPIIADMQGKVRLVFKNYPLDSSCNPLISSQGHAYACRAAVFARCAGLQGEEQFWRMHDALFDIADWGEQSVLDKLSEELSLDRAAFAECIEEEAVFNRVRQDVELGAKLEVRGTPTIFLNGRRLEFSQLEVIPGLLKIILEDQLQ